MEEAPTDHHGWLASCRPFFTAFNGESGVDRGRVRERVELALRSNCDAIVCFVESEGAPLWPSAHARQSELCRDGVDLVGALVEEARAAGLRVVAAWMGVHCQSLLATAHPSWLQSSFSTQTVAAMCLNSPFGELLRAEVNEVCRDYPVDGVYFDGLYARRGGCFCDGCRRVRRAIGVTEPVPPPGWVSGASSSRTHWLSFANSGFTTPQLDAFRRWTVAAFLADLRASLLDLDPRPAVIIDTLGVRHAFDEMGHDLTRLAGSLDAILLEAYWDNRREPIEHIGMEVELVRAETGLPVWWPRWLARHPDGIQVPMPTATVEAWIAQCAVHAACPVPVEQGLYFFDDSLESPVARAMGCVRELQDELVGMSKVAEVALLHAPETRARLVAEGWGEAEYFDSFCGAYLALNEAHVAVDVVNADAAGLRETLASYRGVVVPSGVRPAEECCAALAAYVCDGGALMTGYLAGQASPLDQVESSSLSRLLGAAVAGVTVHDGRPGPESWGGSVPVNYCQAGTSLGGDLAGRNFAFAGPYLAMRARPGDDVIATIRDADFKVMDGERFFAWQPGMRSWPLGVAASRGRGRMVHWAGPLDAAFMCEGDPIVRDLFVSALRWAMEVAPATGVTVGAPPCVDVATFESGSPSDRRLVVVLANRACNPRYGLGLAGERLDAASSRINHPVRYLIDVADISLAIDRGWDGEASLAGSDAPSRWRLSAGEAGGICLQLSRLHALEAVQVTWLQGPAGESPMPS